MVSLVLLFGDGPGSSSYFLTSDPHLTEKLTAPAAILVENFAVMRCKSLLQPKTDFYSSDGRVVQSVCLLSCRLGFDSESGQTNDLNIGIHSFPA